MYDLIGLPRNLVIHTDSYHVKIKEHEIVDLTCYNDDVYDEGSGGLFNLVAYAIHKGDVELFTEFEKQGLYINNLTEFCIREIVEYVDWIIFDMAEHHRNGYDVDCDDNIGDQINDTRYDGSSIKQSLKCDHVCTKIISPMQFHQIWQKLSSCFFIEGFLKANGADMKAVCTDALQKSKTYEELVKNLTPISSTYGKKWSTCKEDHIRSLFATQLQKEGLEVKSCKK